MNPDDEKLLQKIIENDINIDIVKEIIMSIREFKSPLMLDYHQDVLLKHLDFCAAERLIPVKTVYLNMN